MVDIEIVPEGEFRRVESLQMETNQRISLLADMCRLNALAVVKRAGSGHLGSSLSSMEIFVQLYYETLNVREKGVEYLGRDIFFSSKGHDAPGLYAVLYSLGILDEEKFVNLRRYEGLEGHPDISTPGIEANSGSLGMGISKGRGIAWAKRYQGNEGHVYVLIGDGELQEGQNYEAFQNSVQHGLNKLTVIVDHNKVQSDKFVKQISDLGDIEKKIKAFGWHVQRCNGNTPRELKISLDNAENEKSRPSLIVCDTLKGCGISFMEHPVAMTEETGNLYPWHAGAPVDRDYLNGYEEILKRINNYLNECGAPPLSLKRIPAPVKHDPVYTLEGEQVSLAMPVEKTSKAGGIFVAEAYGAALVALAENHPELVVLDADLAADCRIRDFEIKYPDRFLECGIAEQDMVSTAGGLARQGLLPVVNSFTSFLTSRANEQIYNNASEKTKIIYGCHYSGLIPAGPGKSHQSIRDISLLSALPNMVLVQPSCPKEAEMIVYYAVEQAQENVTIRLNIGPSPRGITLPADYMLTEGCGCLLRTGPDAIVFAYGPVMLHETLLAAEILHARNINITVVNMPWLNRLNEKWFKSTCKTFSSLVVVEDHAEIGGLGDSFRRSVINTSHETAKVIHSCGVEGYPAFGTPPEALKHHKLDGISLANRIKKLMSR